jgi:oxaloacetate decarboxylase gamma subunit
MLQNAVTQIEPTHSISSQLSEAGVLMGVGMLSVFLFLSLLIIAMFVLAKLVQRFPNSEGLASKSTDAGNPMPQPKSEPSPQMVAAISAAIIQHQGSK